MQPYSSSDDFDPDKNRFGTFSYADVKSEEWELVYSKVDPLVEERGFIEPTEAYKHNKYKVLACVSPANLTYENQFWIDRAIEVFGEVKDFKWVSPDHDLHGGCPTDAALLAIY